CGRTSASASSSRRWPSSSSAIAASVGRGSRRRASACVLRTRILTAAIALPSLWLIIEYLPPPLFAGFIGAVAARALHEYFSLAWAVAAVDRLVGILCGLSVTAGVITRRPDVWGAGLAIAVVAGFTLALWRHDDLPGAMNRLGLSLLGALYVGFFVPH